jgi:Ca-activated chloride channel family protein
MCIFCRSAGSVLAVLLLVSCAKPAVEEGVTSPTDSTAAQKASSELVVTGTRIPQPNAPMPSTQLSRSADAMNYLPAPPPPAPGMYPQWSPPYHDVGRDKFTVTSENPFKIVREEPVSTFSIDVDTASYSWVRASLNNNVLPQPAAVRTEEMVNYFPYDYAAPARAEQPFNTNVAVMPSPWSPGRKLVRIGIKGYSIHRATRPRANLVFLIDTSGSMQEPNKLPLVKQSLALLLDELDPRDTVAIVTYAGYAGTALESTPASQKQKIRAIIDGLGAGGSTAGAEGICQAYALAEANLDRNGVHRVILATDGDFNVGITNHEDFNGYIERYRVKGVFLSILGYLMGNYNDALMQTLAQNGNGAAAYIDTLSEARKTLVEEASSTLFPIAKDVKIQVEFNPATVSEYRLIGYETRMLNRDDFNNDKVDAGDVGSGQSVTALYEVVPVGGPRAINDLRYEKPAAVTGSRGTELGFVRIRYKLPKSNVSNLIETPIGKRFEFARFEDAPADARFAIGVAAFAELLRGGKYSGSLNYDDVLKIALASRGKDEFGYRSEFTQLVRAARSARTLAQLDQ